MNDQNRSSVFAAALVFTILSAAFVGYVVGDRGRLAAEDALQDRIEYNDYEAKPVITYNVDGRHNRVIEFITDDLTHKCIITTRRAIFCWKYEYKK
jgi:hypothetical protein